MGCYMDDFIHLLTKEHKTGETFIQLCNLVVPSRSDGGVSKSGILGPEQDGRKDVQRRKEVKFASEEDPTHVER